MPSDTPTANAAPTTDDTGLSTDHLIVALDRSARSEAERLIERIGPAVTFYKIGLELLFDGGLGLASDLEARGIKVFLDLKFLDIANTVERAVAQACNLGVSCLTVHGHDRKTMEAAVRGRDQSGSTTKLLAVTVLTSLDKHDLEQQTSPLTPADLALHRARLASDSGFDGVISSGLEARAIRDATSRDFWIVTPGIRLAGDAAGDQARIVTPGDAISAGASHLVVGRPITASDAPEAAARRFASEIARAAAKTS